MPKITLAKFEKKKHVVHHEQKYLLSCLAQECSFSNLLENTKLSLSFCKILKNNESWYYTHLWRLQLLAAHTLVIHKSA